MGVNVNEINPMIVVMADKKTALPVEFNAVFIFSFGVPLDSAYLLVICKPYDTPNAKTIGPTIITVIVTS